MSRFEADEPKRQRRGFESSRRRDEDDDDDYPRPRRNRGDDDDRGDRPRKKRKEKKHKGSGLIIGISVGGGVLLVGLVVLVVVLVSRGNKDKDSNESSQKPPPEKEVIESPQAKLLGSWQHESKQYSYIFNADGTLVTKLTDGTQTVKNYTVKGDILEYAERHFKGKPVVDKYKIEFRRDELLLDYVLPPELVEKTNSKGQINVAVGPPIQVFTRVTSDGKKRP